MMLPMWRTLPNLVHKLARLFCHLVSDICVCMCMYICIYSVTIYVIKYMCICMCIFYIYVSIHGPTLKLSSMEPALMPCAVPRRAFQLQWGMIHFRRFSESGSSVGSSLGSSSWACQVGSGRRVRLNRSWQLSWGGGGWRHQLGRHGGKFMLENMCTQ